MSADKPSFPCCPGVALPTKLRGLYSLSLLPNCPNRDFSFDWDGGGYSGSAGSLKASVKCSGTGTSGLQISWSRSDGACQDNYFGPSGGTNCSPFFISGFGVASAACCPGGTGQSNVNASDSVPVPAGDPPPVCPCPTGGKNGPSPPRGGSNGGGGGGSGGGAGGGGNGGGGMGSGGGGGGGGPPYRVDAPAFSSRPVRYATGELSLAAVDIQSNGFGLPWGHTRSFASLQSVNETLGQGFCWKVAEWSYLIVGDGTTVVLQGGPNSSVTFTLLDPSKGTYVAFYNSKQTLIHDFANSRFVLTDLDGTVTQYNDSTGAMLRRFDPAGNSIQVTAVAGNGFNPATVQRTYSSGGNTSVEQFSYTYDSSTGDYLLTNVLLQRKLNAGAFANVAQASYTYYPDNDPNGAYEDLKTVTTQLWTNGTWATTGNTYYRYWKTTTVPMSSSSSSSSSGTFMPLLSVHLPKYVLQPAMYDAMVAAGLDPLTASDAQLSMYADFYFEYDQLRQVTKETVMAGSQTFTFGISTVVFPQADYNKYATKTVETLPDGNQNIIYANYAGQTILKVFQSGASQWIDYYRYDANGNLVMHAHPSAVNGYSESYDDLVNWQGNTAQYLNKTSGLIETWTIDFASGFVSGELVQQGQWGLPIILRQYQYTSCISSGNSSSSSSSSTSSSSSSAPSSAAPVYLMSKMIEYPDDGSSSSSSSSSSASGPASGTANGNTRQIVTTFAYTFWPGTCAVQQKTTTWPVIPTSQNGSGVADSSKEYFDTYGNRTFVMDERGFITAFVYDIPTGAIVQRIDDVDTTQVTAPAGWTTPSGGGLNLVTDYLFDVQGRTTQVLGPVHTVDIGGVATSIRRATWTVYQDALFQVWQGQGYQKTSDSSFTLYNPVSITIMRKDGKVTDQIKAVRYATGGSSSSSSSSSTISIPLSTPGALSASDSFPQSSYVRWTTTQFSDCCLTASQRIYKLIPSTGSGSSGTNYDETDFGYDVMKRLNRTVSPGGTITRTVFEARGFPIGTWVGTNDTGATATNPAGSGAPNNMVQITGFVYDGGSAGGDGNVTSQTDYVDATGTNDRMTAFLYDFRDRLTDTDGEVDFYARKYFDNLDRIVKNERYNTTISGNLIMRSTTAWDDRGAAFQAVTYAVNPVTGLAGTSLTDNTWRDAARNVVKSLPAGAQLFTKTTFDSLGRQITQYTGYGTDANYAAVFSVAGNTILEQTETAFDNASNVIQTTTRLRYHNAPASQLGGLGDPSTTPNARVTYAAAYPDPLGRLAAMADYGTNGGTSLSRPSTIPARSDACLVNSTTFNGRGEAYLSTDPARTQTLEVFDDRARRTSLIENYVAIAPSSSSSSSGNTCAAGDDTNRTTTFTYSPDNFPATITAVNATTGNQTSTYQYGSTLTESAVASSLLKRYEILPDSVSGSDQKAFTYNRQSQTATFSDQNGSVHTYTFDKLGRQIDDGVTTLGTGVDGAVRRIATSFEVRGLVQNLTSYDNAAVGSGNIVNDVQFAYNSFQQLVTDYQSHSGAVDVSSTPNVQYGYAGAGPMGNTIRPLGVTYPNGRAVNFGYGTVTGINDSASRIETLFDNDLVTHLTDYSYLGSDSIVTVNDPQPAIQYTLIGLQSGNDPDTGDIYRGLDRFSRVKDLIWAPSAGSSSSSSSSSSSAAGTNLVRIQHAYDRASNRLYRSDLVAESLSAGFDELYGYDGLYRLTNVKRGTLNSPRNAIQSPKFSQCWTLDATGNWRGFREDDTGSGTWNLIQSRTANLVNEISAITNTTGAGWAQPAYDHNGNMTAIPQPADPTKSYTGTYDAWNRLVKLVDTASGNTVQTNAYDGRNYRTIRSTYTAGVLSETRHYFYTSRWQVIEERVGSSSNPNRQFVWGLRFIDDLVIRDRDTTGGGTLNERLYAMQDPLGSVVALCNSSRAVQERYAFSPYGAPMILTSAFALRGSSNFDWETLFAGYHFEALAGLFLVRERFLHTAAGAWLSRDPDSLADANALYLYALANPLTMIDPMGLQPMNTAADCLNAFPQPDMEEEAKKAIAKCMGDCVKDIKKGYKVFAKCMAKCVANDASKEVKKWLIQYGCCVGNSLGNPCKCGRPKTDASGQLVKDDKNNVVKMPCYNPGDLANAEIPSPTGKSHCQECCNFLSCVNAWNGISGWSKVVETIFKGTFDKVSCDAACNAQASVVHFCPSSLL